MHDIHEGPLPTLHTDLRELSSQPIEGVDFSTNDREYRVRAQLPGIGNDEVRVTAVDGVLRITGEHHDSRGGRERHQLLERSFGIPEDVELDQLEAQVQDGILVVRLPRRHAYK